MWSWYSYLQSFRDIITFWFTLMVPKQILWNYDFILIWYLSGPLYVTLLCSECVCAWSVCVCFVRQCLCICDSHLHPQEWNVVLWSYLEPRSRPPGLCRWGWASPECSGSCNLWVHRRMGYSIGSNGQKIHVLVYTHVHTNYKCFQFYYCELLIYFLF